MKTTWIAVGIIACLNVNLPAQNIAIGTTQPATRAKLEVYGAEGNTAAVFGGDFAGISIQRNQPAIGFNQYYDAVSGRYMSNGYAGLQRLDRTTGTMNFDIYTTGFINNALGGSTNALTITKTGAVGFGTSPLGISRVTVARGSGSLGTAVFRGTSWASHINYSTAENTYIRGGKSGSIVYFNDISSGDVLMGTPIATASSLVKVGINTATPGYALEVRQASGRGLIIVAPNFANWHLRTGPALAPGSYQLLYYNEGFNPIGSWHPQTCAYAALSDERVKTDIHPLPDIGARLSLIEPVQYMMEVPSTSSQEEELGFIAQDIMKLFPGLVTHDQNVQPDSKVPDMHFMNYDGMAVYAIKIIQEQQQRINALKQRLLAMKQTQVKN